MSSLRLCLHKKEWIGPHGDLHSMLELRVPNKCTFRKLTIDCSSLYHQSLETMPLSIARCAARQSCDTDSQTSQLKRLINRTQSKLDSLGLGTSVLRSLHGEQQSSEDSHGNGEEQDETSTMDSESTSDASHRRSIVYEVVLNSSVLEARLRLSSTCPSDLGTHQNTTPSTARCIYRVDFRIPEQSYGRITETLIHPPDVVKDVESYASSLL